MAIEAYFKQVPSYLLEKFLKYPNFIELFENAQYLSDSSYWQQFNLDLNDSVDYEWFNEATNYVAETLEKLRLKKPEDFKKLESDIPLILAEGKKYIEFYLDKRWRILHFLLTGYDESIVLPFLIGNNEKDNLPAINVIFGGKTIDYKIDYELPQYLTADEVKQVAQALSNFSHNQFHQRLKLKNLKDDFDIAFNILYDIYKQVLNYYQDAASQQNAMFLSLS